MFATPELWLWDGLRVIAGVLALSSIAMIPFSVMKPRMTWHQKARMAGEFGFCAAVVGAYLYQLGTLPEQAWRSVLVFLAVAAIAVGHAAFLAQYIPAKPRRARG